MEDGSKLKVVKPYQLSAWMAKEAEYSENRRSAELEYAKHLDFQLRTNNQALDVVLKINQELREDAESLKNDYDENVNALLKLKEENTSLKDKYVSLQDQNAKGIQIQLKNNTKAKEDNHKMSEEISKLKKEISELTEKTITKQTEDETNLQQISTLTEENTKLKEEIKEKTITKQTEDDTKLQSIEKLEKTLVNVKKEKEDAKNEVYNLRIRTKELREDKRFYETLLEGCRCNLGPDRKAEKKRRNEVKRLQHHSYKSSQNYQSNRRNRNPNGK